MSEGISTTSTTTSTITHQQQPDITDNSTKDDVKAWAVKIVGESCAKTLYKQGTTGKHLFKLTREKLLTHPFNFNNAEAEDLMESINNLLQPTIPLQRGLNHPLVRESGMKHEGLYLNDMLVIKRQTKIDKLIGMMESNRIVFLRSPPFTGKTSLGQLLEERLKSTKPTAYTRRLSWIWDNTGFDNLWKRYTQATFNEWGVISDTEHVYLILDECQSIYTRDSTNIYRDFWPRIKTLQGKYIHILLIAAYSERLGSLASTPVELLDSPHCPLDYSFLFLDEGEFNELVDLFVKYEFALPQEIRETIRVYCNGHTGLIVKTLTLIKEKFTASGTYSTKDQVDKVIMEYLLTSSYSDDIESSRASPMLSSFNENQLKILDSITDGGYQHFGNSKDPNADWLIQRGFVVRHHLFPNYLVFPSPLYSRCYILQRFTHHLQAKDVKVMNNIDGFHGFIIDTIRRMRPSRLSSRFSARSTSNIEISFQKPLEVLWHDEFYYASTALMGPLISPDVGSREECNGKMDFFIDSKYKWGLELLCEGVNQQEHINRFCKGGRYYKMVENEIIQKWIVLDFTSKDTYKDRTPHISHENLWVVLYSKDFKTYEVHRKNKIVDTYTTLNQ